MFVCLFITNLRLRIKFLFYFLFEDLVHYPQNFSLLCNPFPAVLTIVLTHF